MGFKQEHLPLDARQQHMGFATKDIYLSSSSVASSAIELQEKATQLRLATK